MLNKRVGLNIILLQTMNAAAMNISCVILRESVTGGFVKFSIGMTVDKI
jgi:hypothetical protein